MKCVEDVRHPQGGRRMCSMLAVFVVHGLVVVELYAGVVICGEHCGSE